MNGYMNQWYIELVMMFLNGLKCLLASGVELVIYVYEWLS